MERAKIPNIKKSPIGSLSTYRSVGNLGIPGTDSKIKISENLRVAFNSSSVEKPRQKAMPKSKRDVASMVISNEISNKLYQDAQRRQSQKYERILSSKKKRDKSLSVQTNEVSQKYLIKRFLGDFSRAIKSQEIFKDSLSYHDTQEIVKELGFMAFHNDHESQKERVLLSNLWRALGGDQKHEISVKDLRVFLGSVEGFKFDPEDLEDQAIDSVPSISRTNPARTMGALNNVENDDYHTRDLFYENITKSQVKKIQKKYFLFARNRSNYLSYESHRRQAEEIARETEISHQPNIDDNSRKLTQDLHQNLSQNHIPHYEFLLFKGREYERSKNESITIKEKKAHSKCTFYPDVSMTTSFYTKYKDKINDNSRNSKSNLSKQVNTATLEDTTEKLEVGNVEKRGMRGSPIGLNNFSAIPSQKLLSKKYQTSKNKDHDSNKGSRSYRKYKRLQKFSNIKSQKSDVYQVSYSSSNVTPSQQMQKGGNLDESPIVISESKLPSGSLSRRRRNHRNQDPGSSTGKESQFSTSEKKAPINPLEENTSEENYDEEIKDTMGSPEKIDMLLAQNRKEYLEDSSLDSFKKNEELAQEEVLRESAEYIENLNDFPPKRYPILFVDVNLGEDQVERLTVLEGDTSREVAEKFCHEHGLNIKL